MFHPRQQATTTEYWSSICMHYLRIRGGNVLTAYGLFLGCYLLFVQDTRYRLIVRLTQSATLTCGA